MRGLMLIVMLGLRKTAYAEITQRTDSCERIKDRSIPTFFSLIDNGFVNVSSHTLSSEYEMAAILQLLKILQWKHMIVFVDHAHSDYLQRLRPFLGLTSVHEIGEFQHRTGLKQLLQHLHKTFFPKLNFLLLSSFTGFLNVLQTTGNLVLRQLVTSKGGRSFSDEKDIDFIKGRNDVFPNTKYRLNNRTLIVSTLLLSPFVVKSDDGFEGYLIEVLNSIAATLNFSYEIVNQEDMGWGRMVDGRWDGLVGQLQRREVDLVVATLTIHEDREKVMDFLYPPIFAVQEDIMYKLHTETSKDSMHIFLTLFSPLVFIILIVTLVVSSVIGYVLFSFEDAVTERKGGSDTWTWKTRMYTVTNTFFYMFGILLLRGVECKPRNQSTRFLLFTWSVFSVIIAACYSANLVSVFSVEKPTLPFKSLGELVRQQEYKWGFYSGTVIEHIFKSSKSGDIKLAWEGILKFNKTDPEVLIKNYSVHLAKVKTEKYALIIDRHMIEQVRSLDCNIRNVGQDIMWQQLGIGASTDYPLKREIEDELTTLQDSGLPDIWWRKWGKTEDCLVNNSPNTLTLPVVSSIFCFLCVGLGVAGITLIIEIIINKHNSLGNKTSFRWKF